MEGEHATVAGDTVILMPPMQYNEESAMDFRETSFFRRNSSEDQLPSPSGVLEKSHGRDGIMIFEELQLVVKVGQRREVNTVQAISMRFVRGAYQDNEIPVPEVFGWRICEPRVFIYMELIDGEPMMDLWPSLMDHDKKALAEQVKEIVFRMKRLRQRSRPHLLGQNDSTPVLTVPQDSSRLIGSVCNEPVQDVYFRRDTDEGPFGSVEEFNDRLEFLITSWVPVTDRAEDDIGKDYSKFLSDDAEVHFCHGDLNLSNIMVSGSSGDRKVSGIIDWEQAGWHPEFWQLCKMHLGMLWSHDWKASGWIEKVT